MRCYTPNLSYVATTARAVHRARPLSHATPARLPAPHPPTRLPALHLPAHLPTLQRPRPTAPAHLKPSKGFDLAFKA
jgi:hypothetical protein